MNGFIAAPYLLLEHIQELFEKCHFFHRADAAALHGGAHPRLLALLWLLSGSPAAVQHLTSFFLLHTSGCSPKCAPEAGNTGDGGSLLLVSMVSISWAMMTLCRMQAAVITVVMWCMLDISRYFIQRIFPFRCAKARSITHPADEWWMLNCFSCADR